MNANTLVLLIAGASLATCLEVTQGNAEGMGCGSLADIAFTVDSSRSVDSKQWIQQIDFLKKLVGGLGATPDGVNYAISLFAQNNKKMLGLTGDKSAITKLDLSAKARTVGDATYMDEGFDMCGEILDYGRAGAAKFCIMLTDGDPTSSYLAQKAAIALKAKKVTIIMILIGDGVAVSSVKDFVSVPAIVVTDFNALEKVLGQVSKDVAKTVCALAPAPAVSVSVAKPLSVSVPVTPPAVVPAVVTPAIITPPAVQPAGSCGSMADVAIVVDSSGSVLTHQWKQQMDFMKKLIQGLNVAPDAINYAVGFWAQTSRKLLPLTGDKSAVLKLDLSSKARNVGYSTYMDEGFDMAGEFLAASTRKTAPKFCVMLTDGSPTSRGLAASASKKLKAQGVTVIMLLIGNGISVADVKDLVSVPAIVVSDFNALDKAIGQITADIAKFVCAQATPATPPVVTPATPTTVVVPSAPRVSVTPPAIIPAIVEPPSVVLPPPAVQPAGSCGSMADVAFVVDSSGSIGPGAWAQQIDFLKKMILGLNIAPDAVNYALGMWAQSSKILFDLTGDKATITKLDLSHRARSKWYVGDTTYMDGGFDSAGVMLAASTRKTAPKFCVMLTDGSPTSRNLAASASKKLKAQGVTVIIILIGSGVSVADVKNYVSVPAIVVSDFNALDQSLAAVTAAVAAAICSSPAVATSAPQVVSVPVSPVVPVTPPAIIPAIIPAEAPTGCGSMADVAIVVDSSGSILPFMWGQQIDFLKKFVAALNVGPDAVNYALGMWATGDKELLDLTGDKSAITKLDLSHKARNYWMVGYDTYMDEGFDMAVRFLAASKRKTAKKFSLMITDGSPTSVGLAEASAKKMLKLGITSIMILIGNGVGPSNVVKYVSTPAAQHTFKIDTFNGLAGALAAVSQSVGGLLGCLPVTPPASKAPTALPTADPTHTPTEEPTDAPTHTPTDAPTDAPTHTPSEAPTTLSPTTTNEPSFSPTASPTEQPTADPTQAPTNEPTAEPTQTPTAEPTAEPTATPTAEPTETEEPTAEPYEEPTATPIMPFTSSPRRSASTITKAPIASIVTTDEPTEAPVEPATGAPVMPTIPPQTGPCRPAGHLHLDFGGDIANFGDKEQAELSAKISTALNLTPGQLQVTRHKADESGLNYGALGGGRIWHPTKVQLNFKFIGEESIELGHELEQKWGTGQFQPLPAFPLLRIEIEEIYCTDAPTAAPSSAEPTTIPTEAPTEVITAVPTHDPTASPTVAPTATPTAEPTVSPTEAPTTLSPTTTDEPSFSPSASPTEHPTAEPTVAPTAAPTAAPTEVPTDAPTDAPTNIPTEVPTFSPSESPTTESPTELPTTSPTKSPTGCLIRAAKMHVLFKQDSGRRLLETVEQGVQLDASFPQTGVLQAAIAQELSLSTTDLTAVSFQLPNGVIHTELMFKGLNAIALGHQLETKVLANQFNPIPGYPIRRLYMEEIFDCGKHAAGATHSNDMGVKDWAVQDVTSTAGGFVHH